MKKLLMIGILGCFTSCAPTAVQSSDTQPDNKVSDNKVSESKIVEAEAPTPSCHSYECHSKGLKVRSYTIYGYGKVPGTRKSCEVMGRNNNTLWYSTQSNNEQYCVTSVDAQLKKIQIEHPSWICAEAPDNC